MYCEESELDSTSDGEGAEDMPPLTDSEMSDIGQEEGDRPVPPPTDGENSKSEKEVEDLSREERGAEGGRNLNLESSREANRNKKVLKKRKSKNVPEPMSETSDNSSGTESDGNTEEDYSNEDHVYMISLVANLRRQEIMNLKPLRTQSKRTPRVKGQPPDVNEVCPIIFLEETKKLIGDNLL